MKRKDSPIDVPSEPEGAHSLLSSKETGEPKAPEPVCYEDWEGGGRAIDF